MSSWGRRLAFVLVALIAGTAGIVAGGSPEQPAPFSRSRWLAERAGTFLSSRGLLPATEPLSAALLQAPAFVPELPAKARPTWTRVSLDILAPDGGQGQPETQAEPYLAIDPAKETRLLAAYQEGRFANGGARALTYAWSKNGGRTWTEALVPGLTHVSGGAFEKASDPWVAFGPGGRAYYCSLLFNETNPDNGIYVSVSKNGGRSWGPPVAVHTGDIRNFDDKQAIVVDNYSDSPYRGRIYVGWDTVVSNEAGTAVMLQIERMAWSGDGGASYSPAIDLERDGMNIGVIPLVGPGGVVHAVWAHMDTAQSPLVLHASRSEDGGVTWSEPVQIAQMQVAGVRFQRSGDILPTAAVDPRTGRLYVAWMDGRFTSGVAQVALSRSDDGGRTWSAPQRVSDGPGDAPSYTPALAVSGDSRVAVSYYSLRNDPSRLFLVDLYAVTSRDGVNFGGSRRVSSTSFDVRFAAVAQELFLGDYQGLVGGSKSFYALWIGTLERSRLDSSEKQPDAFVSKIK
ncbi:MAG TPA: sialidase family protein [Thermoanaerobaculia bacterium]|nr:sialidase family protein [Thermoanaerobaculia bacterium]